MSKSNENPDTAETLQRFGEQLAALERHVFEQDKEMLAISRQLEGLRGALLGMRERLSEPSVSLSGEQRASADGGERVMGGGAGLTVPAYDEAERPPHY